ncbi:PA14 domain-containing protein [Paenibacillus sp. FSL K6-2859]|uniref:PA14 domain-containing protein n=1 Tax=Paenibacillus sp. FSL K6-2859 TaxID=2921482 RepID=UPI0030F74D83
MNFLKKVFLSCFTVVLIFIFCEILGTNDLLQPVVSPNLAGAAANNGLKGEYYNNMDLTGLTLTRTDSNVDFSWGLGSPNSSIGEDSFSVRWTGTLKPKYSQTYTFYMVADDGVRLWVNGQLLIDKWVTQASELTSLPITLTAEKNYDICIEYFENGGGATAILQWASPSQSKQIVPQSQLNPPVEVSGMGLKGEYYDNINLSGLKLTRTDVNLNFNWGLSSPTPSLGADTFSVRWTGTIKPKYSETYTYYMVADDGVRLWIDGQLLIDTWVTQASELKSLPITLIAGQNYDIRIEYFENDGGATAILQWSSASQIKQIVPQSQLYLPAEITGTGLKGEYYDNMDLTGLKLTRTDADLNYNWGAGSPDDSIGTDTFSIRWTGTLKPKYSEMYTFYLNADDSVRLWIDGKLLLNRWENQSGQFESSPISLIADQQYDIQIEYFENLGDAAIGLLWTSPSQTKQFIPQSQLYLPAKLAGVGLIGEYYDNIELTDLKLTRTDPAIHFGWGLGSPDASIDGDTFSARWTGTIRPMYNETYTFYFNSDDGARLWVNGQLIIDQWVTQASELTSLPISLIADQNYDIRIEYFENSGGANAILSWSSASQIKQIVPQSKLFLPYKTYTPVEYHYNAGGRIEYIRYSDGTVVHYYYDANGNLIWKNL